MLHVPLYSWNWVTELQCEKLKRLPIMEATTERAVISVENIRTSFGSKEVHRSVSFSIQSGIVAGLIGGSGTGKSVLLREIVGLLKPSAGNIKVLGIDVWNCSGSEMNYLRSQWGMLFQDGALFSALTVAENIAVPMIEDGSLPESCIEQLVMLRLCMSGLEPDVGLKMPASLSGGMRKRAALARALALEPRILFLDEPTSGLDPITARAFDQLIQTLAHNLGITVLLVTHDLDTIKGIVDDLIVLDDGRVLAQGPVEEVAGLENRWIQSYFGSGGMRDGA